MYFVFVSVAIDGTTCLGQLNGDSFFILSVST